MMTDDTIRKYKVEALIGEGGMGVVWKARDVELGRAVAIKMIHPRYALEPDSRNRFIDEARIQATLVHQNICTLFDAFDEGGNLYLVQEYVDGLTVKQMIEQCGGPLPVDQALEIARGVLAGLAHAHEEGVIHRDIKPSNIIVNHKGRAKIMDFGIAKALGGERLGKTKTGMTVGTPEYMSPEQIQGKEVDARSDIYSFGMTMYEMLTGDLPFERTLSEYEIQKFHVDGTAPPLRSKNQTVPAWLEQAVHGFLTKEPAGRGCSAEACIGALKPPPPPPPPPLAAKPTVYDGVPLSHRPNPPADGLGKNTLPPDCEDFAMFLRSRRTRRINQAIMFAVLVGFIIVIAALSYSAWYGARERAAQQRAAEQQAAEQRATEQRAATKKAAEERVAREEIACSARADAPELAARKLGIPLEKTLAKSGIVLRLIPAGAFLMGSPASEKQRKDDEVQHTVRITKPFYMGKYEVTQGQWQKVMGNTPAKFKDVGANGPVERVSWNDCQEFLRKLEELEGLPEGSIRLPTEAEWEYACRAGTQTAFCYGDDLDSSMANFDGNYPYGNGSKGAYRESTMPVGSFKPNAWGLYDMHGNVWEWCQDWYGQYSTNDAVDPRGSNLGSVHVLRGGSWCYGGARDCRSACRYVSNPGSSWIDFGFRLSLPAGQ